jgi:AraC-like DNA-binding protein
MLLDFVRVAWSPPAPTRPLSLRDLAAGAYVSSGYLSRLFRHHYGIGPVAAFELLRLARAATLLLRSNLSVAAVSHDCGFANPYHFSHRFHRVYGQPPGRHRHASPGPAADRAARAGGASRPQRPHLARDLNSLDVVEVLLRAVQQFGLVAARPPPPGRPARWCESCPHHRRRPTRSPPLSARVRMMWSSRPSAARITAAPSAQADRTLPGTSQVFSYMFGNGPSAPTST